MANNFSTLNEDFPPVIQAWPMWDGTKKKEKPASRTRKSRSGRRPTKGTSVRRRRKFFSQPMDQGRDRQTIEMTKSKCKRKIARLKTAAALAGGGGA